MKASEPVNVRNRVAVLCYSQKEENGQDVSGLPYEVSFARADFQQKDYTAWINSVGAETVALVDIDRVGLSGVQNIVNYYLKNSGSDEVGYVADQKVKLAWGIFERTLGTTARTITNAPVLIGPKTVFSAAYGGTDLGNPLAAVSYSLQKNSVKFRFLENVASVKNPENYSQATGLLWKYSLRVPANYLYSGAFFKELFSGDAKVQRDMVWRMLMLLFAVFCYFYMPVVSRNYGISADEFIDNNQAGYVLNYFADGSKEALSQPKTLLHFYGSSFQVITTAVSDFLHIDDIYTFRHFACSLIGAWGIWIIGLLGLRFGGGLCGLLSMLMLFFTPRFFGHTMNNLKDAPFAVGYLAALYFFIKLFDSYPRFKPHYVLGAVAGIFLAFGTRAGGLMLFPYLIMYGGLFYILRVGWKDFYKFVKYKNDFLRIVTVILSVLIVGYVISILLWPYALQSPVRNVLVALQQFTNIGSGIKTMFDGQQMMSNMLPVTYAPKYLCIGVPMISILGLLGYLIYMLFRRREFTLVAFFLLFAAIFPVLWVMHKNSNLYGGIRHMLFVMPVMVVIAAKFWTLMIGSSRRVFGIIALVVWMGLLVLPARHMICNQPNDYIYFNEFAGGLKGAYGDYDTDYFFNSLKNSSNWFKKNVQLPAGKKTIILTNHVASIGVYFKADTNVKVMYSRYYEKHAKDWDYAIWGNMYIDRYQLKNGLFPPKGTIYSSLVDGFPMSVVVRREHPGETEGFRLERNGQLVEALQAFQETIKQQPENEEIWSRMSKLSFMTGNPVQAEEYARHSLQYQPQLNEALYILSLATLQQRKYDEALHAAQKMLDQNAFSVDGYFLKASVYKEQGKYKEAIDDLNKALAYRPNFDRALLLAGEIMMINRDYKTAIGIYNRLLKVSNNVQVVAALADAYCRMGNYQESQKWLEAIAKVQPDYFPAYKVKVRMALLKKQWTTADALIRQSAQKEDDAELFVLRALYYKGTNQAELARKMTEAALKLEPNNVEARGR